MTTTPFALKKRLDPYAPSGDPNASVNDDWGPGGDPTQAWSGASSIPAQAQVPQADPNNPYGPQLNQVANQMLSAYQPKKASTGRLVAGALVGAFTHNPQLEGLITGSAQRNREAGQLGQQYGLLSDIIAKNQAAQSAQVGMADTASQVNLRNAQAGLATSQSQMIDVPGYGPMPAGLAKVMFPAQIRATGAENVAATNKRFIPVSGVGVVDTQDPSGKPTVIPGSQQGITITPDIAKDYEMPAQFVGRPMKLSDLASFQRGQDFQNKITEGANGPAMVNTRHGTVTPLGLGNPSLGHAVQVADPNSPGNSMYETAGNAINTGAQGTQSAAMQVPRTAMKAAVPTKIGDLTVGYQTMLQHAQLLRQAAAALHNGDQQTLNGLKNSFKNAFGYSGPITAKAIADAYGGEVTSVISKGHITDAEVGKTNETIDPLRQSYAQLDNVLGAYQSLAQSKMNMLNNQTQAAVGASQPHGAVSGGTVIHYDAQGNRVP